MTTTNLLIIKPVLYDDATMTLDSDLPEKDYPIWGSTTAYLDGERIRDSHFVWESLVGKSSDVTISISDTKSPLSIGTASPGNIVWGGLKHNDVVVITTTGSLPSPLVPNQVYYVHPNSTSTAFLMTEPDGQYITTVDPQSGTHAGWTRPFVTWPKTLVDDGNGNVVATPHGWPEGTSIVLSTTGALPTGLTAGTRYYVLAPTDEGFFLSSTVGGAPILTSGTQSGTHTARATTNYNRTPADGSTVWSKVSPTNIRKPLDVNASTRAEQPARRAVTISSATPAYVLDADNNFEDGAQVAFFTDGSLPSALTAGTTYFVKNATPGVGYEISATSGGASISTIAGGGSGQAYVVHRSIRYVIHKGVDVTGAFIDSATNLLSARLQVIQGGVAVYDQTIALTGKTQAIFEGLPAGYPFATLRFDITASDGWAMGVLAFGSSFTVGTGIQLGARLSHQSFSRQETNAFGDDVLVPRGRARLASITMRVAQADVDSVWQALTALDSVPCMWRATSLYAALNPYGYFKTMEKLFDMQTYAVLQLTIKSMSTNT